MILVFFNTGMPPQKLLNPPLVVISLGRLGSSMDGVPVPPGHPRAAELKYTVPVRPRRGGIWGAGLPRLRWLSAATWWPLFFFFIVPGAWLKWDDCLAQGRVP